MNPDSTNDALVDSFSISQDVLEKNLIQALTRMQNRVFDDGFLDGKSALQDELPLETFLGFVIGNYRFVVQANCFCEVFIDTPIAAVPNAPICLAGLSNIRGVLIPVYQLHSTLTINLPKKRIIFCIGKGDSAVGLIIDELPVSLSMNANHRKSKVECNDELLKSFISAVYVSGQYEWLFINGKNFAGQLQTIANQLHKNPVAIKQAHESTYI